MSFFLKHKLLLSAATIFLFTLMLHIPFALFDSFGEQDAARIATAAQYGYLTGHLTLANQWPFSTPLYIHLLNILLRAEIISGDQIIWTIYREIEQGHEALLILAHFSTPVTLR